MKFILAAALLLTLAVNAFANMANPVRPGDRLGEPSGELRKLHIEHEDLRIDLRPIAAANPAEISATYQIRNDSSERDVVLVFVGVNVEDGHYSILFDGAPVDFRAISEDSLPITWRGSQYDQGTDSAAGLRTRTNRFTNAIRFTLHVPSGPHRIQVRYAAAIEHSGKASAVFNWRCVYILAPARQWASFGSLHATVLLPDGWGADANTQPKMTAVGDSLVADWTSLPSDDLLVIKTAMPLGPLGQFAQVLASWLTFVLFSMLIAYYAVRLGKRNLRTKRSFIKNLAGAMLFAVATTIAFCIFYVFVPDAVLHLDAGVQTSPSFGYGAIMLILISPMMALFWLLMIGAIAWAQYRFGQKAIPAVE